MQDGPSRAGSQVLQRSLGNPWAAGSLLDSAPHLGTLCGPAASRIRGELASRDPDAVMLDSYDTAVIGITVEDCTRAVYSMERMLEMVRSGGLKDLPEEEAQDHFDCNTLGALAGIDERNCPVIVDTSIVG